MAEAAALPQGAWSTKPSRLVNWLVDAASAYMAVAAKVLEAEAARAAARTSILIIFDISISSCSHYLIHF
jgi:hypothetical protein